MNAGIQLVPFLTLQLAFLPLLAVYLILSVFSCCTIRGKSLNPCKRRKLKTQRDSETGTAGSSKDLTLQSSDDSGSKLSKEHENSSLEFKSLLLWKGTKFKSMPKSPVVSPAKDKDKQIIWRTKPKANEPLLDKTQRSETRIGCPEGASSKQDYPDKLSPNTLSFTQPETSTDTFTKDSLRTAKLPPQQRRCAPTKCTTCVGQCKKGCEQFGLPTSNSLAIGPNSETLQGRKTLDLLASLDEMGLSPGQLQQLLTVVKSFISDNRREPNEHAVKHLIGHKAAQSRTVKTTDKAQKSLDDDVKTAKPLECHDPLGKALKGDKTPTNNTTADESSQYQMQMSDRSLYLSPPETENQGRHRRTTKTASRERHRSP